MPRSIKRVARSLLRVSKHRMIELPSLNSGPLNRRPSRDRAQFLRGIVFDLSAIAAKRRAHAAYDSNISRFQHESRLYELGWLAKSQLVSLTEREICNFVICDNL